MVLVRQMKFIGRIVSYLFCFFSLNKAKVFSDCTTLYNLRIPWAIVDINKAVVNFYQKMFRNVEIKLWNFLEKKVWSLSLRSQKYYLEKKLRLSSEILYRKLGKICFSKVFFWNVQKYSVFETQKFACFFSFYKISEIYLKLSEFFGENLLLFFLSKWESRTMFLGLKGRTPAVTPWLHRWCWLILSIQ